MEVAYLGSQIATIMSGLLEPAAWDYPVGWRDRRR